MSYTALYRKFRPTTFDEVKGQDHIVTTLKNQIRADRIGHAYLFCGTRGTGKTSVAKILAKAVNCEHPVDGNPCLECEMCKRIAAGVNMNVVEIDAASNNGVDNIREIVEEVSYTPAEGKYRVYIIDEVHMLSTGAFNALLKTLEEPPAYVIFILATTEVNKIPITILSRCQRYDFRRIGVDEIEARLADLMQREQIDIEERAIRYVAKAGDGSMRDALSLLDQCIAFNYGQTLTYDRVLEILGAADYELYSRMTEQIYKEDLIGAVTTLEEVVNRGTDLMQFVADFVWYLRNLMLLKSAPQSGEMLDVSAEALEVLTREASEMELPVIMRYIRMLSELQGQIRYSTNKRILLEMTLIRMCKPQTQRDEAAYADRLRKLEDKVENGIVMAPAAAAEKSSAPQLKPLPPKDALPEDIRTICERWQDVLRDMEPGVANYLKNVHPSLGDNNVLLLVCQKETLYDMLRSDSRKTVIQEGLDTIAGSHVRFEVVLERPDRLEYRDLLSMFPENEIPVEEENF